MKKFFYLVLFVIGLGISSCNSCSTMNVPEGETSLEVVDSLFNEQIEDIAVSLN